MHALDDTDPGTQARRIERDIQRTREAMDHTLTALEHRLAPREILHQSARRMRERLSAGLASTIDTLQRHPAPIAIASALVGAGIAFRPNAMERRERQAAEDFERVWAVLAAAAARAKQRSWIGAGRLAESTWRVRYDVPARNRAR